MMNQNVTNIDRAATFTSDLAFLVKHAKSDTGGSRRCAEFILSLYDGDVYRASLQELLYISDKAHLCMMRVFHELHSHGWQLDCTIIHPDDIEAIIDMWGLEFAVNN